MGVILNAVQRFVERRNLDVRNPNHWIVQVLNEMKTKAGVQVGPESAMAISAVYACVRVISETIASLPLKVYERSADGGKKPVGQHPVADLIRSPNPYQTTFEYFETLTALMNLRGNNYSGKNKTKDGIVTELLPLDPTAVKLEVKEDGKLVYIYSPGNAQSKEYPADAVWHAKGLSTDGLLGLSPISVCREALGLAAAAEAHGSAFFRDGARSPGIVKIPGRYKETATKNIAESLREKFTGEKRFQLMVFEDGLDWQNIGVSNEDSQFLETRQFQVEEIARIFRVPCVLIGHPDKTATYASAEQFFLSFVTHCVRPWCERIEQSFNRHIIPAKDQERIFVEFSVDGLLRGDIQARYNAYAQGRQWGFLCADDIRKLENLDPLPDGKGKIFLQPVNMVEAGTTPAPAPDPANDDPEGNPEDPDAPKE